MAIMPKFAATSRVRSAGEPHSHVAARRQTLPIVTPEARRYAVKELARRAGVPRDFFEKWIINITPERTSITFGPGLRGEVRFVHEIEDESANSGTTIPVARAGWLGEPHDYLAVPDLILPFCRSRADSNAPLYRVSGSESLTCDLDLPRSLLFTLSRVEEIADESVDEHGRFPASASLAVQHEYLERPIFDEHGLAFQQALVYLFPSWQPEVRAFHVKLTHDIDDIGIPFELRTAVGHGLKRRRPMAALRDLFSPFTNIEPAELSQVRRLAAISTSRGLDSAFYWKGSPRGPHDSGYDPASGKAQQVITFLRRRGFELGVHPGYQTFGDRASLAVELDCLRRALQVHSPGGRQHYLRWSPDTWLDWEACGLSYDSSLGFADRFGFRAGTSLPYRPWSFRNDRELNLIEVPLILMDCTPVKYMKLPRAEGLKRIAALVQRTRQTGGVFTLLWHNTPLLDPEYDGWYEPILDLLGGARSFDVPAKASEMW